MIEVKIAPRQGDRRYEIHVGDAGDIFLVSHQGYENAADAERIARRLFGPPAALVGHEPVELTVEFRDGKCNHEALR